jgi:hypothetical protein
LGPFPLLPAKKTSQKHKTHLPAVSGGGFSTTARFKVRFLDFEPPGASAHLCTTRTTTGGEVAARVEVRQHPKNHTTELAGLQRILPSAIAQAIVQRCSHSGLKAAWSSLAVEKAWISGHGLDGESDAGMPLRFSRFAAFRGGRSEKLSTISSFIFAVIL